jgi:hypothetical protein
LSLGSERGLGRIDMRPVASTVVCALALLLLLPVSSTAETRGGVISTSEALALERDGTARATVDTYLEREDVAASLSKLGVDPEVAKIRAAALSPAELAVLAERIEDAPAGGDVIAVLGVTFLVLLILELVGVIDIFKKL